ncbi:MAG: hypothetical protein ACO2Z9_04560 [Crocinitomicaceae bacterium]
MKGCQEITELVEKGKTTNLSAMEKISVRTHLLMCRLCRDFRKDSNILDRVLRKALLNSRKATFTSAEKKTIVDRMKEN